MKHFLESFNRILNNQKGNLDLGGGEDSHDDSSDSGEDLSTEGLLASLDSESGDTGEVESTETSSSEESASEDVLEDDLEAKLKGLEVDTPEGEVNPILEELNKLGIIHNGLPVEFEDLEKVKEHLSKGFDYTQKTQELSEARKSFEEETAQQKEAFEAERESFKQEQEQNAQALNNYSVFQNMIMEIQANDPELFAELDNYYTNQQKQMNQVSPQVAELNQKIQELESKLNGTAISEEDKQLNEIKANWEKGLSEVQTSFGPKLRSLGIKPDWNKIQEVWKADSSNSLTVKGALFAQYGEAIEKAMANKSKIAETRAKVARTGAKPDNNETGEVFGMKSGNSYENEAFEILKTLD